MDESVHQQQVAYYRARASEYDLSVKWDGEMQSLVEAVEEMLAPAAPYDQALELACGTGNFTRMLARLAHHLTALDAAPEMLEINRRKVGSAPVEYVLTDLFQWEPDRRFDLVLAAFWFSHVPPDRLGDLLGRACRALGDGGTLVIVEQNVPTDADRRIAHDEILATRAVANGDTFTIVKAYHSTDWVAELVHQQGLDVQVQHWNEWIYTLMGKPR